MLGPNCYEICIWFVVICQIRCVQHRDPTSGTIKIWLCSYTNQILLFASLACLLPDRHEQTMSRQFFVLLLWFGNTPAWLRSQRNWCLKNQHWLMWNCLGLKQDMVRNNCMQNIYFSREHDKFVSPPAKHPEVYFKIQITLGVHTWNGTVNNAEVKTCILWLWRGKKSIGKTSLMLRHFT